MTNRLVSVNDNFDFAPEIQARQDVRIAAAVTAGTPTAITRQGAYSFGGTVGSAYSATAVNYSIRNRFILTQNVTRMRVRFRNFLGLSEVSPGGVATVGNVFIGVESLTSAGSFASTPVNIGNGASTNLSSTAEYITAWYTPTATIGKAFTPLLLSFGAVAGAATDLPATGGAQPWIITDQTKAGDIAPTGWVNNWTVSLFEVIVEYEFINNAAKVVLFLGHSAVDSYSATAQTGYYGQVSGFPQKWARKHGGVAVVNAYTGARMGDWAASKIKWGRFPTIQPDAIVVSILANDVFQNVGTAGVQALFLTFLATVQAKYPGVPIFVCNEEPYNQTGTAQETTRQALNLWLTQLDTTLIAGIFDFDRAVRGTTITSWDANFVSPDGIHAAPRGFDVLSDAVIL